MKQGGKDRIAKTLCAFRTFCIVGLVFIFQTCVTPVEPVPPIVSQETMTQEEETVPGSFRGQYVKTTVAELLARPENYIGRNIDFQGRIVELPVPGLVVVAPLSGHKSSPIIRAVQASRAEWDQLAKNEVVRIKGRLTTEHQFEPNLKVIIHDADSN